MLRQNFPEHGWAYYNSQLEIKENFFLPVSPERLHRHASWLQQPTFRESCWIPRAPALAGGMPQGHRRGTNPLQFIGQYVCPCWTNLNSKAEVHGVYAWWTISSIWVTEVNTGFPTKSIVGSSMYLFYTCVEIDDIPNITEAEMKDRLKNLQIQCLHCCLNGRKAAKESSL